ncbi:MAG: hypothetical protein GC178_16995 [Flavobacteriales bacterium]|nr:hypothetical protein [Flavobacteriales bacterium]
MIKRPYGNACFQPIQRVRNDRNLPLDEVLSAFCATNFQKDRKNTLKDRESVPILVEGSGKIFRQIPRCRDTFRATARDHAT